MEYENYLQKMRDIQKNILEYIESEDNEEDSYLNLIGFFNDQNIFEDPHIFKETITLILCISSNHHRTSHFFYKIDQILLYFKDEILKNFPNYEIFTIFRKNYRILLFMIKEQMIKPDVSIFSNLTSKTYKKVYYPNYFSPEFKLLFATKEKVRQGMTRKFGLSPPTGSVVSESEKFDKKRFEGENDDQICRLIREDEIESFTQYISKANISLSSTVGSSIFETNSFLINKNPSLIEYAAFFGSLKIFNYLMENKIELTPSLWLYAIHSNKMELIHILENNKIVPDDNSYQESLLEAIKCHHNEMTNYIMNTILKNQNFDKKAVFSQSIRYNNYVYFPDEIDFDFNYFFDLCKYDYYSVVEMFLKENINLNQTKIPNSII